MDSDEDDVVLTALRQIGHNEEDRSDEEESSSNELMRPGQQVKELKKEIQSLLAKLVADEDMPSAFACEPVKEHRHSLREEQTFEATEQTLQSALAECREKLEASELERREVCTAYEVQLESLRLEASVAKARARKLCRKSSQADVFEEYERAICALRRRCASLRRRNLHLENSLDDRGASVLPSTKVARHLEHVVARLEAENADLRSRLRTLPLAERVAESQSRLAAKRAKDLDRERRRLDIEKQTTDKIRDDLHAARQTIADLTKQGDDLRLECVI